MESLIEALQIFLKYENHESPTYCMHDELHVVGIDPEDVSEEDINELEELGFFVSDGGFVSYRYGNA